MPPSEDDRIRERWEELYLKLLAAISRHGKDSAFGDGDFWLIDDDWGGRHQKLCIARQEAWTPELESSIRSTLRHRFRDWGVYVVFDDGSKREGRIVYFDATERQPRWD